MKNNDNFLADFFALAAIALKEKTEKPQSEKDTTEKQCKCTENHCKNQQDFNKELLEEISKCQKEICAIRENISMELYEVNAYISCIKDKLCVEIEKSRTEND